MANQPHPTKKKITIAVPKTLKAELLKVAKQRQTDLTKLCTQALYDWLAHQNM